MDERLHVHDNSANFSGRARRREFWMFSLVQAIIAILFTALIGMTGGFAVDSVSPAMMIVSAIYGISALATFIPGLAVTVRRLHDTGKSGWFSLVSFVPVVGSIIVLIFLILDGEPRANKWGMSPKPGLVRA